MKSHLLSKHDNYIKIKKLIQVITIKFKKVIINRHQPIQIKK